MEHNYRVGVATYIRQLVAILHANFAEHYILCVIVHYMEYLRGWMEPVTYTTFTDIK